AVIGEMREVIAEGVDGVEVVLGKCERAGSSGRPRIDERRLNDLILLIAAADKAAAVFDMDVNLGPQVEAVAEIGEALAHDGVGDDRVDLDAGDVAAAAVEGARNVPSAARSDDQRLGGGTDDVRKRRDLIAEMARRFVRKMVEIVLKDGGSGVAIDD